MGWGGASYAAIVAFLAFYLVAVLVGREPNWLGGLYAGASIFCFIVYGLDKNAAIAGRQRVSENTLILIGLAGGWPGAIVAQQLLRHKSVKAEFRSAFWGSVGLNVLIFSAFTLPALVFFLLLPLLQRQGLDFWLSLAAAVTALAYLLLLPWLRRLGGAVTPLGEPV